MRDLRKFDLVIVGGGIVGAWALYLASRRHPNLKILLIERSTIGSGATSHSAGVFVSIGRTELEKSLSARSMTLYSEARAFLGIDGSEVSSYWISALETAAKAHASIMDVSCGASSVPRESLSDTLNCAINVLDGETIQAGGTPVSFDPASVARSLVRYCRHLAHVSCWEGAEVVTAIPGADGIGISLSDGSTVIGDRVIVAVGPWVLRSLGRDVAREHGVRIKRVVAIHIDRPPVPNAPAIFFPDFDAYLMPLLQRNQWLFSFHRKQWDCDPEKVEPYVGPGDLNEANTVLNRLLPGLADHCRGGRAFCDAYAASGEPVVAPHPASRHIVVAGAGAGKGFRLAPGIAEKALAHLSLTGVSQPS